MVPMNISPKSALSGHLFSRIVLIRVFNSSAAFSVKVNATMVFGIFYTISFESKSFNSKEYTVFIILMIDHAIQDLT